MGGVTGEGALRAARAALQTNGGFEVQLRMPGLAVSGSDAEQLGLGTPQFQDVALWPAVWRKLGQKNELLVCAEAVSKLLSEQNVTSAEALFAAAVGVVAQDVLYRIEKSVPMVAANEAIAYRLAVSPPVTS